MKKYPCTLKQFLLLGQLGFLEIGMPQQEVEARLGKPQRKIGTGAWEYYSVEMWWDTKQRIDVLILNMFLYPAITLPEPLGVYDYFPGRYTTLSDIQTYLALEGIQYMVSEHTVHQGITLEIDSPIDMLLSFRGYDDNAELATICCCDL